MTRHPTWLLALVALVGCNDGALDLPRRDDAADSGTPTIVALAPPEGAAPIPPPPEHAEGTVTRIERREDVPLVGYRVDAKPGDWMLRGGGLVAVVSAKRGRVVDFAPEGGEDGLDYVNPVVYAGLEKAPMHVERIEPVLEGRALHVVTRVLDKPLALHAYYSLEGGVLHVDSAAAATSDQPIVAVTLGEIVSWGNTPTWVEGHGFILRAGSYSGEFIARELHGVAYAMCSKGGRLVNRFDAEDSPGFHENPRTGEEVVPVAAFGVSRPRSIVVSVARGSLGEAVDALPCLKDPATVALALPAQAPAGASVEVARCTTDGVGDYFTRFAVAAEKAMLPEGCFKARVVAPGHARGAWVDAADVATSTGALPTAGTLRWTVKEKNDPSGAPLPSKLIVRGTKRTRTPNFGEDGFDEGAVDAIYTVGRGEQAVPPGTYRVSVQRGFEYDLFQKEITVVADKTTELNAILERVVDTRGFVTADLHVHAIPSPDAPTPLVSRVRSLAAVGVEVAVATDHNAITDYRPAIEQLGYQKRIASVVGDEVTTRDVFWGHFNVFPLAKDRGPVPFANLTPAALVAGARAAAPGPAIVQVNHPRMGGIGYLELLRMDERDVKGWIARSPLAELQFDAIEVFNGDHYDNIPKVERAMADWYALLNAGFRETATGNSDSHKAGYQEAGVPRNYVAMPSDEPDAFDEKAFVEAIKAHRVIVSSGPFVRFEANGQGVGSSIAPGHVDVSIQVQAPPWVDVSRVQLVKRGEVVEWWDVPQSDKVVRFEGKTTIDLVTGDWILVVVRGKRPMTILHRSGALPFAFTNPIWAD